MRDTKIKVDKELALKGKLFSSMIKVKEEKNLYKKYRMGQAVLGKLMRGMNCKGIDCKEIWIKRSGIEDKMRVRIYKPKHFNKNVPGLLWLHGGGYAMGAPEMCNSRYKFFIDNCDCVIIAPDYRLSLTDPYPAALEDAYDALLWMKKHAAELGIRSDQLMVGGESAGGGLTAALSLYARDKKEVCIAFQMPLYPMLDDRMITESSKNNNAPVWDSVTNKKAWKQYLGDLYGKNVPEYAAPARTTDYTNLPPTYTLVGDLEVFRDEAIQYIDNLKNAGIPAEIKVFKNCYHAFDILVMKARISQKANHCTIQALQKAAKECFAEQP